MANARKPAETKGTNGAQGTPAKKTRERRPWGGSVFLRADKPGRWWIKFRDPSTGKRVQKVGAWGTDDAAKTEAARELAAATGKLAADVVRGVREVTAGEFIRREFLPVLRARVVAEHAENVAAHLLGPLPEPKPAPKGAKRRKRVKLTTQERDERRRGGFADFLGSLPLCDVGTDKVEHYLAKLRSGEDAVSPATVARFAASASAMFRAAVDANAARVNPVRRARLPKAQQYEPHAITPADVDRIIANVPANARAPFVLLADLGLRLGELLRLTWQHVAEDGSQIVVVGTKSGRTRAVPVPSRSRALLETLRAARVLPLRGEDLVIRKPCSESHLQRLFHDAANAAGLPVRPESRVGVRVHDVRHCYASALARNGVALSVVASLIGDSLAVTSSRYARHVPASEAARAVASLERRESTPETAPATPQAAQSA